MVMNWMRSLFHQKGDDKHEQVEVFGSTRIPLGIGRALIDADPKRTLTLRSIRDHLPCLSPEEKKDLVDRPVIRLALWIVDLPAGEEGDDCGQFGLLNESLRVAEESLSQVSGPGFKVSSDPVADQQHRVHVSYATFAWALLHSLGKATAARVSGVSSQEWNAFLEPLAGFRLRNGLGVQGSGSVAWRTEIGKNALDARSQTFLPLILPQGAMRMAGSWLGMVMKAFLARGESPSGHHPAAWKAAQAIARASQPTLDSHDGDTATEKSPVVQERSKANKVSVHTAPVSAQKDQVAPPTTGNMPRRIAQELDPARLIVTMKQALRSGNLYRNSYRAPVLVREDYCWFEFPKAFKVICEEHWHYPYSHEVGEKLLEGFLDIGQIVPRNPARALVQAKAHPSGAKPKSFVRVRTKGFLSREDLAALGMWPREMTEFMGGGRRRATT